MITIGEAAPERRPATFEVICAGEPVWKLRLEGASRPAAIRSGVVHVARALAGQGLRVGLATVLDDDTAGRASLEKISALGIDTRGVRLTTPAEGVVVIDAGGGQSGVVAERERDRGVDIPAAWSARVLLLSGVSPLTAAAAALCKAARRARRAGAAVVLDLSPNLRLWAGREPRVISMLLREVDVVRASYTDLAVVGMDALAVQRAMRPDAVLVVNDNNVVAALGPFGEVRATVRAELAAGGDERLVAAICAELARPRPANESAAGRWHRILSVP